MGSTSVLIYEGPENTGIFSGPNGQTMMEVPGFIVDGLERLLCVNRRWANIKMTEAGVKNVLYPRSILLKSLRSLRGIH